MEVVLKNCDTLEYRLHSLKDRFGYGIECAYTGGDLSWVGNIHGKTITFYYDTVGDASVLKGILGLGNDTLVRYFYVDEDPDTGLAILDSVAYADGSWESYLVDADYGYRIQQTTTSDGATWHYEYDASDRVSKAYNEGSGGNYVEYVVTCPRLLYHFLS